MSDLRTTAQKLVNVLDASLYMNDYSGLEVSKNDQPVVSDAIEALREQLAQPDPLQRLTDVQQALEALEFFADTAICSADTKMAEEGIAALRAALTECEAFTSDA